jgi:hypothetical protein
LDEKKSGSKKMSVDGVVGIGVIEEGGVADVTADDGHGGKVARW